MTKQQPITEDELKDCASHLATKLIGKNIQLVSVENGNVLVLRFDSGHVLYIGGATEIAIAKGNVNNLSKEEGIE